MLFNLITAWTPVLIYRISRQLGQTDQGALHAARLVVFSPVFAFWGGALYKEGLVFFVLAIITYNGLVLQEGVRGRSILIVVLGIAALSSLRFYLAALLLSSIVLGVLLARRSKGRGDLDEETPSATVTRRLVVLGALTILLVVSGISAGILEILPENTRELFGQVQSSRDDLATASSGYLRGTDVFRSDNGAQVPAPRRPLFLDRSSSLAVRLVAPEPGDPGNDILALSIPAYFPRHEAWFASQFFR